MTINPLQTIAHYITGTRSVQIADGIEAAIAAGDLAAGEHLPTVRAFADALGVSPTTVSAAFAKLKRRGLLQTSGRRGTAVSLQIINDNGWPHAMHVHGHHFVDDREPGVWRDTSLFARGEKSSLRFVADNPGKWLIHCHMTEHMAAGMVTWFQVD